ncbi:archease [Dactylosporangium roseum]|uniref:Archease n=1 Tax=Dactylosporangium roseum TaxID=47989 RepID=A0ABY5ZDW3_9ACTN|nr:archease [Dactylosporangium roseum]UWZ40345.1 archease [Dactylosporangium roseum]
MGERPESGHRAVPHTADVRFEAWAPSRERCVAEAVAAMVDSFAEVPAGVATTAVRFRTGPGADPDLLVAVLDEVIFLIDTIGRLPVSARVVPGDGGLDVELATADTGLAEPVGAVPKAVSLHDLRFGREGAGWTCSVTLDV